MGNSNHMSSDGYLLGYDIGTSSIKASLLDIASGKCVASAQAPETEMAVLSPKPGFAEQNPEDWWANLKVATATLGAARGIDLTQVKAVGITYQMHGLVLVDRNGSVVRPSIIWCDSRAVQTGERACAALGEAVCRKHLLNSPGNFTASKIRWVMENEPDNFKKSFKAMLPGDFIAMKMTGETVTTPTGLSEMILWDYSTGSQASVLLKQMEIPEDLLPRVAETFSEQGRLAPVIASELGLAAGTPITYRAGDQPNNAFSLKVLEPGEVATTAGTSGVVYGVGAIPSCDEFCRVNTFLHVTHKKDSPRYGNLLCLNGTGSLNSWCKRSIAADGVSYDEMNRMAAAVPIGSDGLVILPFGYGAERTLRNRDIGASIHNLSFNIHGRSHLMRAAQEGIIFALFHGFEIMRDMGVRAKTVRAGNANMFLSPLFGQMFATVTGAKVEIYDTDGSQGAARGAGVGAGIYINFDEAFAGLNLVKSFEPDPAQKEEYRRAYSAWHKVLSRELQL